eukprot:2761724-Amphidinium_carterae.1
MVPCAALDCHNRADASGELRRLLKIHTLVIWISLSVAATQPETVMNQASESHAPSSVQGLAHKSAYLDDLAPAAWQDTSWSRKIC